MESRTKVKLTLLQILCCLKQWVKKDRAVKLKEKSVSKLDKALDIRNILETNLSLSLMLQTLFKKPQLQLLMLNRARVGDKKTKDLLKLGKKFEKKANDSKGFSELLAGFKAGGLQAVEVDQGQLLNGVLPKAKSKLESTSLATSL